MRINYYQVIRQADRIGDAGTNLETIGKDLGELAQNIPNVWKGKASQKYVGSVGQLKEALDKNASKIIRMAVRIKKVANDIKEADERIASSVKKR